MFKHIDDNTLAYIYGLVDPITERVRYVGFTNNPRLRLQQHISASKNKEETNHKSNWIRHLLKQNLEPEMRILEITSYPFRELKEREWISFYGKKNLTNSTDGGEGNLGFIMPDESRKKMSLAKKGRPSPLKGKPNPTASRPCPDEVKIKISKANKGKPKSEETKRKLSESREGKTYNNLGRKYPGNNTSKYIGVNFHKLTGKWQARIRVDGKRIYLGVFSSEIEAAIAFNNAAIKYFGESAKINIFNE